MSEPSDPKRGDIWFADFSPTVGREQRGDRPALVISDDRLNSSPAGLVVVVPLTTTERPGVPWHVEVRPPEGELRETSYALCEQVRAISKKRLQRRAGAVQGSVLATVEDRLQVLLDL